MSTKQKNQNESTKPPEQSQAQPIEQAAAISDLQSRLDERERQLSDALARISELDSQLSDAFGRIADYMREKHPPFDDDPLTHQDDPFMNPAEVGRQLGKSPQTVGRWILDGLIVATFFPNERWMVRKSEVNKLLRGTALNKQVV